MALPQDGQNANALATVKEVPTGKKLIFVDPTTNEGGVITLEDLTTQILKNLTSQTFALDQGTKTLPAALNELNSNRFSICEKNVSDLDNPPAAFILNTDINPKGLPKLDSNGCCVIQHNPGNEIYTAQLAFSFGCEKIAIRTKKTDSWSAWKYFSAQ
jgi:hypothetical protein